jgi:pimeloyl-ACP methyl ester carboxylesterase
LIHGFWVTPRSWEHWIERYEQAGYRVIAPAYPGFEVEVEALNADTSPIEALTVPAVVEHLEAIIGELESPPILIGHSAGGTFVQLLLDHGFGAAGVAINSAPTEGVRVTPPSQIKSLFPALKNPANRHRAVGFTPKQWHYVFANTFSEEESQALYERYHVPASGAILWGIVLANLEPGHQATWVDYKNDDRAPLLFVSGGEDHLMPRASSGRMPSTTSRTPSPRSKSTRAERTFSPHREAGRKSPITPWTGRSPTRRSRQRLPQNERRKVVGRTKRLDESDEMTSL